MTQEETQILSKDLCARLLYDTWVQYEGDDYIVTGYGHGRVSLLPSAFSSIVGPCPLVEEVKPYLRPMSFMTEEECITLSQIKPCDLDAWKYIKTPVPLYVANIKQFDFFLSHYLDWRGLIPMGLALEAPENMYK